MRKWTTRQVIGKSHRKKLDEMIKEASGGAVPGSAQYMQYYHPSLTKLMGNLSIEDIAHASRQAEEWTLEAPPKDIQAR
jgi:hypothetical protein